MDYIILIVLFVGFLSLKFWIPKLLENYADNLFIKNNSYLEEKGKNQATKEDIAEITKQIETIKSTIQVRNSLERDFIASRANHLFIFLEKLHLFIALNGSISTALMITLDYSKMLELSESIMKLYSDIEYERDLLRIQMKTFEEAPQITKVILETRSLLNEYLHIVTHSASALKNLKLLELEEGASKKEITVELDRLHYIQDNPTPEHYDSMIEAVNDYVIFLKDYYKEEDFLK